MSEPTPPNTHGRPPAGPAGARDIDVPDLLEMSVAELTDLYGAGTVPDAIGALDGAARGHMLAARGLDGLLLGRWQRHLSTWSRFPWAGKTFQHIDRGQGTGFNRLHLAGGERGCFPFDTCIAPSSLDGAPCIVLDYDRSENARPLRRLRDELREVAPGLFLGPALYVLGQPRLLFYFACDLMK